MTPTDRVLQAYFQIMPRTAEAAILRLLVELGVQCVGAEEGSLLVLDQRKNDLVFAMTTGSSQSQRTLVGQRVPLGKGLTGLAALSRQVQLGSPTFKDIKQRKRAKQSDNQPTAVIAAPMLVRDESIGVITAVSFDQQKRFGEADATLYARIASVAAVVVDQQRRLHDLESLREGRPQPKPRSAHERLEAQIVDSVASLVRRHPAKLSQIRALLQAIDALATS